MLQSSEKFHHCDILNSNEPSNEKLGENGSHLSQFLGKGKTTLYKICAIRGII